MKAGNCFHLSTVGDAAPFKMVVFENKDGTTTLSCAAGQDKARFESICADIQQHCGVQADVRLEVSLGKVPKERVDDFLAYLQTLELQSIDETAGQHYQQHKLVGKQGDTLTIKSYTNGTLQLQGRHAMLAAHALDFLTNVLPYGEAVDLQLKGYSVKTTVAAVDHELAGHLPLSIAHLGETVRMQLASALALTKTQLPLAEFSAVAFPALKGLEGMLKGQLTNAGFDLSYFKDFGEYFVATVVGHQYVMRAPAAAHAKEPTATELAHCYALYAKQRHGLFHMNSNPETSRVLATLEEAKAIVFDVFGTIEQFFRKTVT